MMKQKMLVLLAIFTLCWTAEGYFNKTVASDGSGDYLSITEAILHAPTCSPARYTIRVKEGVYSENIFIGRDKWNISLIGDGMDLTIITSDRSANDGYKTHETATAAILGQGFIAKDLAFQNTAGREKHQAVALLCDTYYSAFFRCRFEGYQDTLYTKEGIQFFRDCEIYGTVDFIFGSAAVVFQNSIIAAHSPMPMQSNTITAHKHKIADDSTVASGIVLQNCTITAAQDLLQSNLNIKTYLGRPWGEGATTVVMDSFLDYLIDPEGWLEWQGYNVLYKEYNNRGAGAILQQRVPWAKVVNSSAEVAPFTVRYFLRGEAWLPYTGIPYFLDFPTSGYFSDFPISGHQVLPSWTLCRVSIYVLPYLWLFI